MNGSYLNKSGTVWGPPYNGGPEQTAPVAPPPLSAALFARLSAGKLPTVRHTVIQDRILVFIPNKGSCGVILSRDFLLCEHQHQLRAQRHFAFTVPEKSAHIVTFESFHSLCLLIAHRRSWTLQPSIKSLLVLWTKKKKLRSQERKQNF